MLVLCVLGHRNSNNPSVVLASLLSKRAKLHEELRGIEKQVVFQFSTFYCLGMMHGFCSTCLN